VLRSAIANAQQKDGFGGDVDRLFVKACYANQGPSMKRVRPAPMGRAFRVVKRSAHLTVQVAERPLDIEPVAVTSAQGEGTEVPKPRKAKPAAKKTTKPRAKKAAVRKKAPAKSGKAKKG
jgi:large subunit ribosomal protein L22